MSRSNAKKKEAKNINIDDQGNNSKNEEAAGRYMLVEVVDREIYEPEAFESYDDAYAEMLDRFSAVVGIPAEEAEKYNDNNYDTYIDKYKAFTEKYSSSYDWAIYMI